METWAGPLLPEHPLTNDTKSAGWLQGQSGSGGVKREGAMCLGLLALVLVPGKFCEVSHLHIYHQAGRTIATLFGV